MAATAAAAPAPADGRIWFAQALRAVACLLVVASHYGRLFVVAPDLVGSLCLCPPLTGLPRPAFQAAFDCLDSCGFSTGNFGVALFFLVSGFVIPFSLRRHTLGGFFVRRFCRLYPTLWAVQLLVLVVLAGNARHFGTPFPFGARAIAGNALLVNSYLAQPTIEAVCWTLMVEELFYAICAVCAWRGVLGRPAAVLLVALGLAGLALAWLPLTRSPFGRRYPYLLFLLGHNATFVVYIFIGVVLHHLYRGTWRLRLCLPLALALLGLYLVCCRYGPLQVVGGASAWWAAPLAALAVFAALLAAGRRLPYVRWLDWVADLSYPLYLTHATLGYVVIRAVYLGTGSLYLGFGVAFAAVLALSALLHRWVERPGNDLGRRLASRHVPHGEAPASPARQAA